MAGNDKYKHVRAAAYLTQFGLNMVSPIVLCIVIGLWLKNKFNLGSWLMIVAILLGVAASFLNMITFIKTVTKEVGGEARDKKRSD